MLALFIEKNNCDVEIYTEPKLLMSEKIYVERLIEKQKGRESDAEKGQTSKCKPSMSVYVSYKLNLFDVLC